MCDTLGGTEVPELPDELLPPHSITVKPGPKQGLMWEPVGETLEFGAMPGLEASRAPGDSAALNFCQFFELIVIVGILLVQLHIGLSTGSAPARPWHSYQDAHTFAATTKRSHVAWLREITASGGLCRGHAAGVLSRGIIRCFATQSLVQGPAALALG